MQIEQEIESTQWFESDTMTFIDTKESRKSIDIAKKKDDIKLVRFAA